MCQVQRGRQLASHPRKIGNTLLKSRLDLSAGTKLQLPCHGLHTPGLKQSGWRWWLNLQRKTINCGLLTGSHVYLAAPTIPRSCAYADSVINFTWWLKPGFKIKCLVQVSKRGKCLTRLRSCAIAALVAGKTVFCVFLPSATRPLARAESTFCAWSQIPRTVGFVSVWSVQHHLRRDVQRNELWIRNALSPFARHCQKLRMQFVRLIACRRLIV